MIITVEILEKPDGNCTMRVRARGQCTHNERVMSERVLHAIRRDAEAYATETGVQLTRTGHHIVRELPEGGQ